MGYARGDGCGRWQLGARRERQLNLSLKIGMFLVANAESGDELAFAEEVG